MPAFTDNPWGLAEDTVFALLCTAAGSTAKKNAFLGHLPPAGNVWALKVGGGGDVRNTWGGAISELRMDAEIEGIFTERASAQKFALKIINAMPISRPSGANVQLFRMRSGGQADITFREVTFANAVKPSLVWAVSIGCEMVFNTKANV